MGTCANVGMVYAKDVSAHRIVIANQRVVILDMGILQRIREGLRSIGERLRIIEKKVHEVKPEIKEIRKEIKEIQKEIRPTYPWNITAKEPEPTRLRRYRVTIQYRPVTSARPYVTITRIIEAESSIDAINQLQSEIDDADYWFPSEATQL